MIWLAVILIVILLVNFPKLRCIVFHPVKSVKYAVKDSYRYVKQKAYNLASTGKLVAYVGLFGKGKTLTMVHDAVTEYKNLNGKRVYDIANKRVAKQRIHIISNVALSVPYEKLESLKQVVKAVFGVKKYDKENGTLTTIHVLIDEASVQLNSRKFKENIDALFLNVLLTCRHFRMKMSYTTQRFGMVDALLRQVTSYVVYCGKDWRLQGVEYYDAWELENATSVELVQPFRRECWFVDDADYDAYDTFATVDDLEKDCENGEMISDEKILALQCNSDLANLDGVVNPSRKARKASKKLHR